jgi:hypothetical protein
VTPRVQIAPLVVRECGGKLLPVYLWDASRFASPEPADLVVIDGPPALLGGREGTLYQVMDHIGPGTVVLLDDADRLEEQIVTGHWIDNLGDAIELRRLPGFTRGLAAVVVRQPVPLAGLTSHREGLSIADLRETLGPGVVVLVDQNAWGGTLLPERRVVPFMECDGQYWGPPASDAEAIEGLRRLRARDARYVVIMWPAFWWLTYYRGFHDYLRQTARCLRQNDRLLVWDLAAAGDPAAGSAR